MTSFINNQTLFELIKKLRKVKGSTKTVRSNTEFTKRSKKKEDPDIQNKSRDKYIVVK